VSESPLPPLLPPAAAFGPGWAVGAADPEGRAGGHPPDAVQACAAAYTAMAADGPPRAASLAVSTAADPDVAEAWLRDAASGEDAGGPEPVAGLGDGTALRRHTGLTGVAYWFRVGPHHALVQVLGLGGEEALAEEGLRLARVLEAHLRDATAPPSDDEPR
jgi:hypothetical protein